MNLRKVTNLELTVKDENGDLLADSHNIFNIWKNYFCHIWNAHDINNVKHTEMYTAEPFVPEPSSFKLEIAFEKLKRYHQALIKF
jgi:hypothetical protein